MEDIRDAILSLIHMSRVSEDKLERHEFRERATGEQLKKMVGGLEKRHRALEPIRGIVSRLDERLSNVETILLQVILLRVLRTFCCFNIIILKNMFVRFSRRGTRGCYNFWHSCDLWDEGRYGPPWIPNTILKSKEDRKPKSTRANLREKPCYIIKKERVFS